MCIIITNLNAVNPSSKTTEKNTSNTVSNTPLCPTDINRDGITNNADISLLLQKFGQSCHCPEDVSGDGLVSAKDLSLLLMNFNRQCKCGAESSDQGTVF